jgi:hypothetical protein
MFCFSSFGLQGSETQSKDTDPLVAKIAGKWEVYFRPGGICRPRANFVETAPYSSWNQPNLRESQLAEYRESETKTKQNLSVAQLQNSEVYI